MALDAMTPTPTVLDARERNKAACRDLYRRRRVHGLCVRCGTLAEAGKSQCAGCLHEAREAKRERYHLLAANNLCVVCAADSTNGVWCGKHAAARQASRKASAQ